MPITALSMLNISTRMRFNAANLSSTPPGIFMQVGTLPAATGGEIQLSYSFSGSTLYAIRHTGIDGHANVFSSFGISLGLQGVTWTAGATNIQGAGSRYAAGILGISDTVVIVQQRGYFYRSTNTGASFTQMLTTSGGQNNFYIPVFDGTYGYCGGYGLNTPARYVYSNDGWATCTAVDAGPIDLASAALTRNGGNRFLIAGLGSSQSPATWQIVTNQQTSFATGSVDSNQNYVDADPTSGLNAIFGGGNLYYATYPSTTYTTANVTGLGSTRTGRICVSPQGKIVVPMNTGLWSVSSTGGAPSLISAITDIVDVVSDRVTYCYALRGSDNAIYRFIAN